MKKLIWLLPLVCCFAFGQANTAILKGNAKLSGVAGIGTAGAPPSAVVIQTARCDTGGTVTCNATFGATVGAGHYLGCYNVSDGNSSGVSCTMTGETITRLTGTTRCTNSAGFEGDCYISTNSAGGQTVITCTLSATSSGICIFFEISSPLGGHAIDAGGNAHSTTTAMSVATSAATTNANDICIAMAYDNFVSGAFTALSWTTSTATNNANAASGNGTTLFMYTLPGSTGVQTATATAQTGVTNLPSGVLCLNP